MSDKNEFQHENEKEKIQSNDSANIVKTENKTLKFVEGKLNNFINGNNNSSIETPRNLNKIKINSETCDFSCSIDEVRTNWRGVEKEDRRRCYVKVLDDRLILDKTGIMFKSDLGSRTIYFSDISSIDFDKSGIFHVTNSVKLIMRGGEYITLLHVDSIGYDLINGKWKDYKENQNNSRDSSFSEKSQTTADELIKYAELYEKGLISQEEFGILKQKLIGISKESLNKYCGNCGAEISIDSKFCSECGTQVK